MFKRIVERERSQIPNKRNVFEPWALYTGDDYAYGRWFVGRDRHKNNIIRERRAGISPIFHEHNYRDDIFVHTEPFHAVNPEFHFRPAVDKKTHGKWTRIVNTYR